LLINAPRGIIILNFLTYFLIKHLSYKFLNKLIINSYRFNLIHIPKINHQLPVCLFNMCPLILALPTFFRLKSLAQNVLPLLNMIRWTPWTPGVRGIGHHFFLVAPPVVSYQLLYKGYGAKDYPQNESQNLQS